MNTKNVWPIEVEKFLSPSELAERLGVPQKTLAEWRSNGTGPAYQRVGRHVRYAPSAVNAWLEQHLVQPRGAA